MTNLKRNLKLKPPLNLRVVVRNCAYCKWHEYDGNETAWCIRPDGPAFDLDFNECMDKGYVCDRFVSRYN